MNENFLAPHTGRTSASAVVERDVGPRVWPQNDLLHDRQRAIAETCDNTYTY